jgi:hypothetical protein
MTWPNVGPDTIGETMSEDREDKELGQKLKGLRHDRYENTKNLIFDTDPEKAARMYPFDKRSIEILGIDKWREINNPDND